MIEGAEFTNETSGSKGPGARLRLMREAKSIPLEEMAKQLRFTPQRLAQIENDEYAAMGSSTFARGYLRSYARTLGMAVGEVEEILRSFDSRNLAASIRTNKPVLINERMANPNSNTSRRLGLLGFVVVLGLVGFWWHGHDKAATVEANAAAAAAGPAAMPATSGPAPQNTQATDPNAGGNGTAVLQTLPIQSVPINTTMITTDNGAASKNDQAGSANKAVESESATNTATTESNDAKPKVSKHRSKRAAGAEEQSAPADSADDSNF